MPTGRIRRSGGEPRGQPRSGWACLTVARRAWPDLQHKRTDPQRLAALSGELPVSLTACRGRDFICVLDAIPGNFAGLLREERIFDRPGRRRRSCRASRIPAREQPPRPEACRTWKSCPVRRFSPATGPGDAGRGRRGSGARSPSSRCTVTSPPTLPPGRYSAGLPRQRYQAGACTRESSSTACTSPRPGMAAGSARPCSPR